MKKQEFAKFIENSDLEESDKKEWGFLVDSMPEDAAEALLGMFSEFPNEIGWFNEIYKKKKEVFSLMKQDKTKGEAFLREIVREEKEKLNDLAK